MSTARRREPFRRVRQLPRARRRDTACSCRVRRAARRKPADSSEDCRPFGTDDENRGLTPRGSPESLSWAAGEARVSFCLLQFAVKLAVSAIASRAALLPASLLSAVVV